VGIEPQKAALRRNPDVLVATPGRLLDLMGQGECNLSSVEVFVLDEADRMFDMGFIRDIRKVISVLPQKRQTLLFSATMPREIEQLANGILKSPARVEVAPVSSTAESIEQFCYFVETKERLPLLKALLEEKSINRCIVFTRMKHMANRISEKLQAEGISSEAFHSNKSQTARQRALAAFKAGKSRVLVATDIAARGLDVEEVEVVVNYDLPDVPETYVHRIGRAGRAGRTGIAWSLVDEDQRPLLRDIERTTKCKITLVEEHPFATASTTAMLKAHEDARAGRGPAMPRGPSPLQRAMQEGREHKSQVRREGGGGRGRDGAGRGGQSRDGGQSQGFSQRPPQRDYQGAGAGTGTLRSAAPRGDGTQRNAAPRGEGTQRGTAPRSEGFRRPAPRGESAAPSLASVPVPKEYDRGHRANSPSFGIRSESAADLRAKYTSAAVRNPAPEAQSPTQEDAGSEKPKRRFAFWKKD
jgi:ATP-dependent RNA helicase RhlE